MTFIIRNLGLYSRCYDFNHSQLTNYTHTVMTLIIRNLRVIPTVL
jgi:hypothetical protein